MQTAPPDEPSYLIYDDIHAAVLDAGLDTHEYVHEMDASEPLPADPELRTFVETTQLRRGARILDIGCGSGRNSVFLAKQGFKVTAVDVSPNAIELTRNLARKSGVKIAVVVVDSTQPGALSRRTFDAIVDLRCSHIICETALRKAFFRNLFESLAPGGWYFGKNSGAVNRESAEKEFGCIARPGKHVFRKDGQLYLKMPLEGKRGAQEYVVRWAPRTVYALWPRRHRYELTTAGFREIHIDHSNVEGRKPLQHQLLVTARRV